MRAGRCEEVASTRASTVPVEGLWRELAGVAPTLGIGGDPPALTAGSSGDARQVRRQDPAKSRGNRVQTRTLVESHVGINDLSDYACMLAVHMTYIILTTCIVEERHSTRRIGAGGPHTHPGPPPTPPTVSAAPQHAWCRSRARGRQGAAQRHEVRAQEGRK